MKNVRRVAMLVVLAALAVAAVGEVAEAAAYPRLSKPQVKCAQSGVPRPAAKWAPLVNRYFSKYLWTYKNRHRRLTVNELHRALWVIHYESGGDPNCVYMGHYGLFQCRLDHFKGRRPLRPVSNIATAAMLYVRRGWQPWAATAYRPAPW